MLRPIITAVLLAGFSVAAQAQTLAMQENAPERHVVVKGDTLWDLAGKYLKDPWQWPRLWQLNQEQVRNPHLIYPGDVIVLDRSGEEARLRLLRAETVRLSPAVRSEPTGYAAIPAIDPTAIAPFLSQPLVIETEGLKDAPYIVATEENRVVLGAGNRAYVHGIGESDPLDWQIYQLGKALIDPDSGEALGREAVYLGDAKVRRHGEPATLDIVRSVQEIRVKDRLVPMPRTLPVVVPPHAPEQPLRGRVISAYGGVAEVGQNAIVTLNLGSRDGLAQGHVLALHRHGRETATDRDSGKNGKDQTSLRLPDERYGLVYVFRVFDRVSYALVRQITRQVNVLDVVQTP